LPRDKDNGDWAVTVLELKQFEAPLSAFVVDADPGVRIRVAVNALLLQRRGQTIIVDTGTGVMAHLIDGLQMDLDAALRAHRVKPTDIDLVILTHLHGDHVGGALHGSWPDDLTPAFPNARVVASAVEVEWSRAEGLAVSTKAAPSRSRHSRPCWSPSRTTSRSLRAFACGPRPGIHRGTRSWRLTAASRSSSRPTSFTRSSSSSGPKPSFRTSTKLSGSKRGAGC